jgi:putative transposase
MHAPRGCLDVVVGTSLTALCVVRELDRIIESRGSPRMIVSNNGTVTSNAVLAWQITSRLATDAVMASSSFNCRLRHGPHTSLNGITPPEFATRADGGRREAGHCTAIAVTCQKFLPPEVILSLDK